ncbi:helix-turn-helix domain-containing protein [Pseudoalteromonas luteoviolacea]|uniref:helix-turn-helix domain-containing protein n=1 Tax=Pseudoalteromonas luteoviolacea TaxID=43657 RepID=UPI001152329A|nr:helix-turn-helix transcriptional regulator [Pseudoalteromonas luteoviolacea]TQF66201.1 helix-turn-helix transcriptional regulator [Pseudoalteromonas luteoviolacea]
MEAKMETTMETEKIIDRLINEVKVKFSDNAFLIKVYSIMINKFKRSRYISFNVSEISSCLFISERSLYRRLKEQGTTYFKIKDEIRKRYSIHLLSSKNYTIKKISKLLYFRSTSAFIYRFKSWYGCTPKKWEEGLELLHDKNECIKP